jgi:uncharacterized protein with GYD domain
MPENSDKGKSIRRVSCRRRCAMSTYVVLSRFSPEAFREPGEFKQLAEAVSRKIKSECPGVSWKQSYATLGRFDVIDIVEADDPKQIEKAAMLIRAFGHSTTETLLATPWKEFLAALQ